MVRTYKRKLGARAYKDYTNEVLNQALSKVTEEDWSLQRASREYKIPYGTLNNKFHGRYIRKNGGQTVFSISEEKVFISAAITCGEWGFPLEAADLRQFAKNYLDSQGRNIAIFPNNLPGNDWMYSMLKRHNNAIVKKMAANIKRSRASVSRDDIKKYFDNLSTTLQNIPPSNVFNYDETNVQDDPGKKKMLFRRGTKYPERVCNFAKSATTIMMCGSASGLLLPPYIIYKSERMWLQWTENGPKGSPCCNKRCCALGARYNRTKHGWMDAQTFTDWFTSAFLPHAKELEGRKVLLGDNLSSHFTNEVLQLCRENDIDFVCLPKNSTHLTQPLDVGFFRAFKTAWRSTLSKWKHDNFSSATVDKKDFPHLLANTLNEMDKKSDDGSSAIHRDVISSFRATGIVPLDPERVLHKLPDIPNVDENVVHNVLVNYLQEKRFGSTSSRRNIKRQKLDVQPGKSITGPESSSDEEQDTAAVMEESSDDAVSEQLEEETEYFSVENDNLTIGAYLLVNVAGGSRKKTMFRYVGIIQNVTDDGIEVMGMKSVESTKTRFKTVENDIFVINASEVVAVLPNPDIVEIGGENIYMFEKSVDIKEI